MRPKKLVLQIHTLICWILTPIALLSACNPVSSGSPQAPTRTAQRAVEPLPTNMPFPTYTPYATYTPYPTYTALPTYTLPPTSKAPENLETAPTPATELVETLAAAEFQNCKDRSGPRQRVRVENTTGGDATLYLYGSENYLCSIPPGTNQIYVANGIYDLSALMCSNQLYTFGSHVINPTWVITLKCP